MFVAWYALLLITFFILTKCTYKIYARDARSHHANKELQVPARAHHLRIQARARCWTSKTCWTTRARCRRRHRARDGARRPANSGQRSGSSGSEDAGRRRRRTAARPAAAAPAFDDDDDEESRRGRARGRSASSFSLPSASWSRQRRKGWAPPSSFLSVPSS